MSAMRRDGKRVFGAVLMISGMLLVFICLPMQALVFVLGVVLAAAGLMLLK